MLPRAFAAEVVYWALQVVVIDPEVYSEEAKEDSQFDDPMVWTVFLNLESEFLGEVAGSILNVFLQRQSLESLRYLFSTQGGIVERLMVFIG